MKKEYLDVVDGNDRIVGRALRKECHGNPALRHRSVNVFMMNLLGDILLVKRAKKLDTDPGKWSPVIGEHLKQGEDYETAAKRGLKEELGIRSVAVKKMSTISFINDFQSEFLVNFIAIYDSDITNLDIDRNEVDAVRWIFIKDLKKEIAVDKKGFISYIEYSMKQLVEYLEFDSKL
ncbi:MAG: NUDIX domain-containing protein [Candidatus Aenigmatarchaeota archaeon]